MNAQPTETATLGGGCFWCLEAVFVKLNGVQRVVSGYAGGHTPNPTYPLVCTGRTGHAEVVQITFDPQVISFEKILGIFFDIHDPTTLNRQGADVGEQYRSIILYHSEAQKTVSERVIQELERAHTWPGTIVTQVVPLTAFHPAEDYHQNYFQRNPNQPYCRAVIAPKLAKFVRLHAPEIK